MKDQSGPSVDGWEPLPTYPISASLDGVIKRNELRRLLDYWRSKMKAGKIPARRDLDPLEFRYVLGHVVIVDVYRNPWRFLYRVHGTELVTRDGFDMTGKWLSEHPEPEYRDRITAAFTVAVESGGIMHGFRNYVVDGRVRNYEVLALPLADDGVSADKLFVIQMY